MDERCKVCGGELTDAKVCTDCGARHAYRLDQLVVLAEDEDAYEVIDEILGTSLSDGGSSWRD